jgi:hypothetical protein
MMYTMIFWWLKGLCGPQIINANFLLGSRGSLPSSKAGSDLNPNLETTLRLSYPKNSHFFTSGNVVVQPSLTSLEIDNSVWTSKRFSVENGLVLCVIRLTDFSPHGQSADSVSTRAPNLLEGSRNIALSIGWTTLSILESEPFSTRF